ncbi:hypothetical protein PR048_016374 [Dryococelus australis]|uniref:Uncharacterized protein n=1 Tax=Dryococelus australis TaxID=614101 RepID=A0ABQ9HJI8_9NEOP|nr:hypothetical protein PR048_016374 [Dryococelus australis]
MLKRRNGRKRILALSLPASPDLLKLVFCKSTKNCQRNCGCEKAGLCCSIMCLDCRGNCNNIAVVSQDEEDERDLETKLEMVAHPLNAWT